MNSLTPQSWQGQPLPRAYARKGPPRIENPLEPVTIRLHQDQIDVIDKHAFALRITRSEFLRNYIIHSLNLPIDGKCRDDDIFGALK